MLPAALRGGERAAKLGERARNSSLYSYYSKVWSKRNQFIPRFLFAYHRVSLYYRSRSSESAAKKASCGGIAVHSYVLRFQDIDKTKRTLVGGKGANLGELSRIPGIHVPDGFCVSTEAFKRIVREASLDDLLDQLALLKVEDRDAIGALCATIRQAIEAVTIPDDICEAISRCLADCGEHQAYAVRSSAISRRLPLPVSRIRI